MTTETLDDTEAPGADEAESADEKAQEIVREAVERRKYHEECDRENRKAAADDVRFVWVKGAQWPDKVRLQREADDRPWLEINQLPQFIKQVVNDQRQMRPRIIVDPAAGQTSKETAQIVQGLTRGIENRSNAEAAYDSAFEQAVTGGRGYWRICTDYVGGDSFDQEIQIKRIPDAMSVRMDPDYQEPDASDIGWALVEEVVRKDDFTARWPNAEPLTWAEGETEKSWYDGKDAVVVCDYYRKVFRDRTLVALADGSTAWKDELQADMDPRLILRSRKAQDVTVEWYKIAGGEQVLETYEWPGKYIPIVMCVGDELMVDGKRVFQGLIRRARDVQVMYNYWQTTATEWVSQAPRSPWLLAEGQDEGYEQEWATANTRAWSALHYKATDVEGRPLPIPSRVQPAQVPAAIVEQANQCKMDLRATIGIYDPSLGNRSNETSGRAILAREKQGDTATFHFVDNLSRAIALTGRIVVDLIPHYYDTERIVSVIGDDEQSSLVQVNQQVPNPANPVEAIVHNDIRTGKYAVTVEAGPGYESKMAEAADSMMQFIQAIPGVGAIIGDLVARNMPWPGSDQIADRMRAMLPPPVKAIADAEDGKGQQQQQLPPEVAQKFQQMGQQLQQLAQENQQLKAGALKDIEEAKIKASATIEVAKINAAAQVQKEEFAVGIRTTLGGGATLDDAGLGAMPMQGQPTQMGPNGAMVGFAPQQQPQPDPHLVAAQEHAKAIQKLAHGVAALAQATQRPKQFGLVTDQAGNITGAVAH